MRISLLAGDLGGGPDPVVGQVRDALAALDHKVSALLVRGDVRELVDQIAEAKPELIFNLIEEFGDDLTGNIGVCGVLDLLGVPYTGCGPGEMYLAQDKAITKRLLAFENISYPRFALFSKDQGLETGGNLHMPLFVKPVALDASIGIQATSIVRTATELMERVLEIQRECNDAALAEEFIEGREFYVGVLGNVEPMALPPLEANFSKLPSGSPHIYDRKTKWETSSPEFQAMKTEIADIPSELRARLQKTAVEAYRALRVRDYGRVDLRVDEQGGIYVLEVNASCYLERQDEFARAAQSAGIEYTALIQRIVDLAWERARQARRGS
jgi:D-alanine-D-alanine ligase